MFTSWLYSTLWRYTAFISYPGRARGLGSGPGYVTLLAGWELLSAYTDFGPTDRTKLLGH